MGGDFFQNLVLLPSYCLFLGAALPTLRAPSSITSFPLFLRCSYHPLSIIPDPQVLRIDLLWVSIGLSYHYPSRLSSSFFMPGKRGNCMISLCYFFALNTSSASADLFPRVSARSIAIHAQPLST
jgi:hypothetical protein